MSDRIEQEPAYDVPLDAPDGRSEYVICERKGRRGVKKCPPGWHKHTDPTTGHEESAWRWGLTEAQRFARIQAAKPTPRWERRA